MNQHLEVFTRSAQVLARKAKPHMDAFAQNAQDLKVQAEPHLVALTEAFKSSVHSLSEQAKPNLEAIASRTAEKTAEASASVESLRQWCLEQVGCDVDPEHLAAETAEELEAVGARGFEIPAAEAIASRGLEWTEEPCLPSSQPGCADEEAAAAAAAVAAPGLLPPPGLSFETARLLASQREFTASLMARRNPTLLTHQGAVPVGVVKRWGGA
jgi:hypothetical protein